METHDSTRSSVAARRQVWKDRLQVELGRMVEIIRGQPGVRRIVLFGSLATGRARNRSDLDIVVVQSTSKRFMDRLDEFYRLLVPTVETDILVYTPEEWSRLLRTRRFVQRIASEGKVLYEAI
jgi:predicted nucleotidyltransferase